MTTTLARHDPILGSGARPLSSASRRSSLMDRPKNGSGGGGGADDGSQDSYRSEFHRFACWLTEVRCCG